MNTHPLLRFGLVSLLATALASATGFAAETTRTVTTTETTHPALRHADREFLLKAARSGLDEVAISRVAADRSTNPQVKEFAQRMVADHGAANDELAALAASKGVSLPAKDNAGDKWTRRNADHFDRDYIKKMVSDHQSVVKQFEKTAKDGEDADVVAFARKYLPKLQQHLEHATDLERALK